MRVNKKGYVYMHVPTIFYKQDVVTAVTWECYKNNIRPDSLKRRQISKIVSTSAWWCGKCGWVGDGLEVSDHLGDATEEYNALYEEVEQVIEQLYPSLKK